MIKVLNFSTHNENCGIGKYQEAFVDYFNEFNRNEIKSVFYRTSPNAIRAMDKVQLKNELSNFEGELKEYDILHIQHEFGFFSGDGEGLALFTNIAVKLNKKIVITIHTAPSHVLYSTGAVSIKSPRAILGLVRRKKKNNSIKKKRLAAFMDADLIITLNKNTRNELIELVGVDSDKVVLQKIPITSTNNNHRNNAIRSLIGSSENDIVLATNGFLTDKKGIHYAIKAVSLLPPEYKLVIMGGINPANGNAQYYEYLSDLIIEHRLQERVFITGYVSSDRLLDEYMGGVDIALYPYDINYYKLASSAAINVALANRVPIIAFPAPSFIEINNHTPGTLCLTESQNTYEIVRSIRGLNRELQTKQADKYCQSNSLSSTASEIIGLYRSLLFGNLTS